MISQIYIQLAPRCRTMIVVAIFGCIAVALCFSATVQTREGSQMSFMNVNEGENEGRQLEWKIAGKKKYKVIWKDTWYTWHDKHEIPDNVYEADGEPDFIREADLCPGKDGSYSRKNCPDVPDCSEVKNTMGSAKLCINRVPLPFNNDGFYIAVMKCIPHWESCNRCICGSMANVKDGKCVFDGDDAPDDDRTKVSCNDLKKVSFAKKKFNPFGSSINEPTLSPTMASLSPSHKPSSVPTSSSAPSSIPTDNPTNQPSTTPSILTSFKPSKSPSLIASATPSQTPSFAPSQIPSLIASSAPSQTPSFAPSQIPSLIASPSPSQTPSQLPSLIASPSPSFKPSQLASLVPSLKPSQTPSFRPSMTPPDSPSNLSSLRPTVSPSNRLNDNNFRANMGRQEANSSKVSYGVISLFASLFLLIGLSLYIIGLRMLPIKDQNFSDDSQSNTSELSSITFHHNHE